MDIGIIGGAGPEGRGLALRFAMAGHGVLVGSRSAERAEQAAVETRAMLHARGSTASIRGVANHELCGSDLVFLTVPYAAHTSILEELKPCLSGTVLVDLTVPMVPRKWYEVCTPGPASACEEAQDLLGNTTPVVGAFHNISAHELAAVDRAIECDVLICGDHEAPKELVVQLARSIGVRPVDVGGIKMARTVERITPLLVAINIRYKSRRGGIRITGIEDRV